MTTENAKAIPYQGELRMTFIVAIGYYLVVALSQLKSGHTADGFMSLMLCALFGFTAWRIWYTRIRLEWGLSQYNASATISFILMCGLGLHLLADRAGGSVASVSLQQFTAVFVSISWLLKKPVGAVSDRLMEIVDFSVIGMLYASFGVWGMSASWGYSTIALCLSSWFTVAGIVMIACSRAIVRIGTAYEPFYAGTPWCAFAKPVFLSALVPFSFSLLPVLAGEGVLSLEAPLGVFLLASAAIIMLSVFVVPFAFEWYRLERRKAVNGEDCDG